MKKSLFVLGLFTTLVLTACNKQDANQENNINEDYEAARKLVATEELRIKACEEESRFILNTENVEFSWEEESESGASFGRNGSLVYTKADGTAAEDVFCFIDMVDGKVTVEFTNHKTLGTDAENTENNNKEPFKKMLVTEELSEEETINLQKNTCEELGGEWNETDEMCAIEDGGYIQF